MLVLLKSQYKKLMPLNSNSDPLILFVSFLHIFSIMIQKVVQ